MKRYCCALMALLCTQSYTLNKKSKSDKSNFKTSFYRQIMESDFSELETSEYPTSDSEESDENPPEEHKIPQTTTSTTSILKNSNWIQDSSGWKKSQQKRPSESCCNPQFLNSDTRNIIRSLRKTEKDCFFYGEKIKKYTQHLNSSTEQMEDARVTLIIKYYKQLVHNELQERWLKQYPDYSKKTLEHLQTQKENDMQAINQHYEAEKKELKKDQKSIDKELEVCGAKKIKIQARFEKVSNEIKSYDRIEQSPHTSSNSTKNWFW